jgi:hypothetical protein
MSNEVNQRAINDYYEALLAISALAQDSVEVHEAVFAGINFFSKMAFDTAPSEQVARDTILAGIDAAFDDWQEEQKQ